MAGRGRKEELAPRGGGMLQLQGHRVSVPWQRVTPYWSINSIREKPNTQCFLRRAKGERVRELGVMLGASDDGRGTTRDLSLDT